MVIIVYNWQLNMEQITRSLKSIPAVAVIFGIFFVVLGFKASQLGLYIDDHVLIFPSLLKSYLSHFTGYTYDYGLMRPLALIFYYFIYDFHLISPFFAHLFTFSLHFGAGIIIWRILRKGLPRIEALLISLLFISFPFFTEQYGWYSAAIASLSNLILFLEIALINKPISLIKKIALLALMQAVGVLLYESIFFAFVPLTYLLIRKHTQLKNYEKLLVLFLIGLPSVGYNFLRNFVITPHLTSTVRELRLIEIFTGDALQKVAANVQKLFESLLVLFDPYALQNLWINGFKDGWILVLINPLSLAAITIAALAGWVLFIQTITTEEKSETSKIPPASFWFLLSLFTMLPSFFLKAPSFPFRVLALPGFFLLVGIFILLRKRIKAFIAVYLIAVIFCFGITINMLNSMRLQELDDDKMLGDIMNVLEERISKDQKVEVEIINSTHSTQTDIVYGEYLGSCVFNEWCLQAALNRRTGKVTRTFIPDQPDKINSEGQTLVFQYQQGPVLKFLDYKIEATPAAEATESSEIVEEIN